MRDSASEEESRYLAVNSYLAKYSSMRKGVTCIRESLREKERKEKGLPQSAQRATKEYRVVLGRALGEFQRDTLD